MKKNHGCLWYLFVFPIQLGFYLAYQFALALFKFLAYVIKLLFRFLAYVIKILLNACKKLGCKLLNRIKGYSDPPKHIEREIDGSVQKISSNSHTLSDVAQIEHESFIFQPPENADPYLIDAAKYIIEKDNASIGILQRYLKIGFNRAARIMDQLEDVGIVSPEEEFAHRRILMSLEEFEQFFKNEHTESSILPDTNERIALYNNQYDYMDGHDFEYFCADVLRKNGFYNVEVTQGSGDHGVDIFAEKGDISYAIQCKRYEGSVPYKAIQEAYSAKGIYNRDIAVVMTNSTFTQQGIEDAKRLSVKLWDRNKLQEMMK